MSPWRPRRDWWPDVLNPHLRGSVLARRELHDSPGIMLREEPTGRTDKLGGPIATYKLPSDPAANAVTAPPAASAGSRLPARCTCGWNLRRQP